MSDLFASRKVMRNYLAALLTEEQEPDVSVVADVKKQQLNQLLSTVPAAKPSITGRTMAQAATAVTVPAPTPQLSKAPVIAAAVEVQPLAKVTPAVKTTPIPPVKAEVVVPPPQVPVSKPLKEFRTGRFQALFFSVAGLKVALPLKELGGIHQIGPINTLPGKPAWYKGVMLYREQKISVVNTAMWVMPEKYDQNLAETLNYQYVIMLGKSSWGLACESLINTVALEQDDVKWRATEGKRPWLAGLIKEHMCALLDVDAMIQLLAQGAGSSD